MPPSSSASSVAASPAASPVRPTGGGIYSGAASPVPHASGRLPDFTRSRCESLRSGLGPEAASLFVTEFVEAIEDVAGLAVANLITLKDADDYKALTTGGDATAIEMLAIDRWAASQLIQCLDKTCPYVIVLRNVMAERPALRKSAWSLLWYIAHPEMLHSSCSLTNLQDAFKERTFFKPTHTLPQTVAAGSQMKLAFTALPAACEVRARKHGLLRAAIERIPAECASQRAYLEDRLTEADSMSVPPPWTYEQLVHIIGNHILAAAKRGSHLSNILEEVKPRREQESGVLDPAATCHACGKKGHRSPDCKTACTVCGKKACPGHHGGASKCVVAKAALPAKSEMKNAVGHEITRWSYESLEKAHAKRHRQANNAEGDEVVAKSAKSTSMAELSIGKRQCHAGDAAARVPTTAFAAYLRQVDDKSASCAELQRMAPGAYRACQQGNAQPLLRPWDPATAMPSTH